MFNRTTCTFHLAKLFVQEWSLVGHMAIERDWNIPALKHRKPLNFIELISQSEVLFFDWLWEINNFIF